MTVNTELVDGQVRLSFLFDGTTADQEFAERATRALAGVSFKPVQYRTDGDRAVDAKDDVLKVACAFKSALLACQALDAAKAINPL